MTVTSKLLPAIAVAAAVALAPATARAAATIVIVNGNVPGVGFNDPTPAAPVGGNTGTTIGAQRLIAFQAAGDKWGATLDSPVPIYILATFEALTCTATSAVLGSAGTIAIYSDFPSTGAFPGPLYPATWHGSALAKKRAGFDFIPFNPADPNAPADIRARFNSNLGKTNCLSGSPFYLGLDNNHGAAIDLVTVLLHEFAHGLGFQQFASLTTGALINNQTDVYGVHIFDETAQKHWSEMTNAQRVASAVNPRKVVFDGSAVSAAIPLVLAFGVPDLTVTTPSAIAGRYPVGPAAFGPALTPAGASGQIALAANSTACAPITNASAIAGRIALVDRGTCTFKAKALNAQNAGAIAVLVADNVAGGPPAGLGDDATITTAITIPTVRITLSDGNTIKAQLANGPVTAALSLDMSLRAGTDGNGFALLNTPTPVAPGSSVSHWDPIASPNQLMEPNINPDLVHEVKPPFDLTLPLLRDVGWFADRDNDGIADEVDQCPTSIETATVLVGGTDTGVANTLMANGCTIADLVQAQADAAKNHGGFVSGVAHVTNDLVDAAVITTEQKEALQRAAARAPLP